MMGNQSVERQKIGQMFDSIAFKYDFLNHFMSFGVDKLWRRKAIKSVADEYNKPEILDVAAGTADFSIAALKLTPSRVVGIDISPKMLSIGRQKIKEKGLNDIIELSEGASEEISFPDESFDLALSAFGVRNFTNLEKGLSEMFRVLRNNGRIVVLEFSKPTVFPFKQIYYFYFLHVLPLVGRLFSKNKGAYRYLPDTVIKFPDNEDFMSILRLVGFSDVKQKRMTGGIASYYVGTKSN